MHIRFSMKMVRGLPSRPDDRPRTLCEDVSPIHLPRYHRGVEVSALLCCGSDTWSAVGNGDSLTLTTGSDVRARVRVSGRSGDGGTKREMMALFAFSYVRNYSPIQTRTSVCSASPSPPSPPPP